MWSDVLPLGSDLPIQSKRHQLAPKEGPRARLLSRLRAGRGASKLQGEKGGGHQEGMRELLLPQAVMLPVDPAISMHLLAGHAPSRSLLAAAHTKRRATEMLQTCV